MKVTIPHRLTTLNEYILKERGNRFAAANIKKKQTALCESYFIGVELDTPTDLHFHWVLGNKRLDPDNMAFAKKFILDGMIKAGVIANDNLDYITGFKDTFEIKKGVYEVTISTIK